MTDVWLFADDFEDVQVRVPVMLGTILENWPSRDDPLCYYGYRYDNKLSDLYCASIIVWQFWISFFVQFDHEKCS